MNRFDRIDMITEEDLKKLIDQLVPAPKPMIIHAGKGFVREFVKQMYGGSYNFRQLLGLFRIGVIRGYGGVYEIKG